jgi:hypothetical protein
MTQYSILLSKTGTIVSLKIVDADPERFPVKNLRGKHFSRLIGLDCRKDIYDIIQRISRTNEPTSFKTFFASRGSSEGPVVEWTIQPKSGWLLAPTRYLLLGKEPG